MRLAGKIALITGAASGLGAEIARRFRAEGAFVFIADLADEAGAALAAELAGPTASLAAKPETTPKAGAAYLHLDVACEKSWIAALATLAERAGRLDILVNNAGINIRKDIEAMDEDSLDAMLAVNVKGPFFGIKQALPLLRSSGGGTILNMASVCGLLGHRYTNETYTMTKGAVTLLTKAVAVRYAKDGIRCNSIHPSTVDTPLLQAVLSDPARRAERYGEVPLGRLASAADVAAAFVFLASDEAAFINGVAFPVDGGTSAD